MDDSIKVTIDGIETEAAPRETILAVAERLGIDIPTLCYLKGKQRLESCGVCMVEVEGQHSALPACASRVTPGMVVRTDTPELRKGRKTALELLLSDHLGDCLAPCELACPADIDIPEFLRLIRDGRPIESLEVIMRSIAFPGVLGRICPRFCERVCRRTDLDEPISICTLKRYPADFEERSTDRFRPDRKPPTGKRVAIVGAGIVGLTAAYYLLLDGHDCTVYESSEKPGGALRYVIPEFRLTEATVDAEIDRIVALGARIECNTVLGRDVDLETLRQEADAVLLAIGATRETVPEFPGNDLARSGLEFLNAVSRGEAPTLTGPAAVFGSGPTALDTCRTLLRLGAETVSLVMKPAVDASLFFKAWIEDGLSEGVAILDLSSEERIERLPDGSFQCRFNRKGEETVLNVASVFSSGHVEPDLALLQSLGLKTTRHGVKVDRRTLTTSLEGVFAGGNIAQAGRYAVQGSADGRRVARSISRYLAGEESREKSPINVRMHNLSDEEIGILFEGYEKASREKNERVEWTSSAEAFEEVDRGLPGDNAVREAARCLGCDCTAKNSCAFREISTEYDANPKAFTGERPPFERDTSHPEVVCESGKCIKCGRCIAVCEEKKAPLGLTYIGRGFQVRVGVPLDADLARGLGEVAIECVEVCPTGALARRR